MKNSKLNILLIIADQWRADYIGALGNKYIDTPTLDNLILNGTAFTKAYSAVPSCIAARAALFTGMSQKNHGRIGYEDRVPWVYDKTLPGVLSEAGYHTHCVGKMHVFPSRSLMGFNSVTLHDGYLHNERNRKDDSTLYDDYLPWLRSQIGNISDIIDSGLGCNGYTVNPWTYGEKYHPTNWVTTESIDFLRRRDTTKPFFLKVSYHRPHPPLDPPKHYLDRYINRELPAIPLGDWVDNSIKNEYMNDSPCPTSDYQVDLARKAYMAQITHIDSQINRLIHSLQEYEVMDNTIIIFTSDHGEMLYDHNLVAKSSAYESSSRIPLILKFPDKCGEKRRVVDDKIVELRDIMPTILESVGVDIPDSVDGKSLLTLLSESSLDWREYIHGEHSKGQRSSHWIINSKEIYIWYSQTGVEQYFDLENDQLNCCNLVHKKPKRVEYLRSLLINELKDREEGYVRSNVLVVGCKPITNLKYRSK